MSFADPLKDGVAAMYGWDRALLSGDTPASRAWRETPEPFWSAAFGRPYTPREALQKVGTEAMRGVIADDFWIVALEQRVRNAMRDGCMCIVVPDVRFPNEIAAIAALPGGEVWRIDRADVVPGAGAPDDAWLVPWVEPSTSAPSGYVLTSAGAAAVERSWFHASEHAWLSTQTRMDVVDNNTDLAALELAVGIRVAILQDKRKM